MPVPHAPPPLLRRSFLILDAFFRDPLPRSYGQIRKVADAGDASLVRLLEHLAASRVLVKGKAATYVPGPRLEAWRNAATTPTAPGRWNARLEALALRTKLSCALATLVGGKILVLASLTLPDSVSVIPAGGLLHFERDHAASLAILSSVSPAARRELVSGEFSRIPSATVLNAALLRFAVGDGRAFLDRSRARPGVARLAVPLQGTEGPSALYVCGLRTELVRREKELVATLNEIAE